MTACWISFRIAKKTVAGKTYDQRYEALEKAVLEIADNHWKETTSFIVFETTVAFDTAARTFRSKIAPEHDLFLLRRMDNKKATICGDNEDEDIFDLIPYLKTI